MTRRWLWSVPAVAVVCGAVVFATSGDGESGPAVPHFVEEASSSGIDHVYDGEFPFFVGGGVASFDCNDDGKPEVFLAGGTNPAALYVNHSTVGGELHFAAKPSPVTDLVSVTGAYPIDVDSDGVMDLVVLRRGGNAMLRGTGKCTFEDATRRWGIEAGSAWTTAFSATWETDNAMPTLAFGNYLVPDTYDCDASVLWRPGADAYEKTPVATHCALSMLFSDWNHDGHTDLRASNDRNYDRNAREQLWKVRAGAAPSEYTTVDGWRDLTIWGMGIASHDLTGDGKPEVFLTSQADNKLQTLDGDGSKPSYRDIALERGAIAQRPYAGNDVLPSTAWHPEFADVNNDGRIDLFIAKGNVDAQIDYAKYDPNNLLLGRNDGTFIERGEQAGIANDARSRGASLVDLNMDGLLDLVVVNRRVPAEVKRNVGTSKGTETKAMGHWLALRLHQESPNVDAVGSWVEVRTKDSTTTHEATLGGGHASGDAGWIHFGLGATTTAEVRVTFPGDKPGPWMPVNADTFYDVTRGQPTPTTWTPND